MPEFKAFTSNWLNNCIEYSLLHKNQWDLNAALVYKGFLSLALFLNIQYNLNDMSVVKDLVIGFNWMTAPDLRSSVWPTSLPFSAQLSVNSECRLAHRQGRRALKASLTLGVLLGLFFGAWLPFFITNMAQVSGVQTGIAWASGPRKIYENE